MSKKKSKKKGKLTTMKYMMINIPLHQTKFNLDLKVQIITQRFLLGHLGLQQEIPSHWQV